MNIILFLLVALCLTGIGFSGTGYFSDYLGRQQTQVIKGIFVVLVFLRHFEEYVELSGGLHQLFLLVNYYSGQLIVAMFLFYSGYGIYLALEKKGDPYVMAMPRNKIGRLFLRFVLIVLVYLLLGLAMGRHYSAKHMLQALIGWKSVGNSSWYIFAILICYIATYYGYMVVKRKVGEGKHDLGRQTVFTTMGLLLIYCLLIWKVKADAPRYYNTIFCYSAGMWYAAYKNRIEAWIQKSNRCYYGSLLGEMILCGLLSLAFLRTEFMWFYIILAVVFSFLLVQITMKIKVRNRILSVLGDYVFEVYILQRIAMILFQKVAIVHNLWYVYLLVCAAVTALLSWGYRRIEDRFL